MAGDSTSDSTSRFWAGVAGVASLLSILTWFGVSDAHELKDVLASLLSPGGRRSSSAVSVGDCLPVYDTGRGVSGVDWSVDVPPEPVSCDSESALIRVTDITDGICPSDAGEASWTYRSADSGETTKLCVTRIFHKYHCVLGRQVGDTTRLGSMTAVDCRAERIPAKYNRIIHILGVYQAPPAASARNCAQGAHDQTRYLIWLVDDDKTLLCAKIYQGN